MSATLDLAKQLIAIASVTPEDGGCQQIIADRLRQIGFTVESLRFGEVANLWATLDGDGPILVFAGHTDVVPPGTDADWRFPPFTPTEHEGQLFGRGAADMKGSLAAMITAVERLAANNALTGRIGFLITSDEEGDAIDGTKRVMATLLERGEKIDYCVVGEPSSSASIGDTIKIGRRGSLSGKLRVQGIQGHVAYPQLASNPILRGLPALAQLSSMIWDQGNDAFPPTSFQISNINAGTGANNVIPENMTVDFNFRFSTELDADTIKQKVEECLDQHDMEYKIDWHLSGGPFLTNSGKLIDVVCESVAAVVGKRPECSTAGGTSDGRFIAPTGTELVELGPVNASIHKVDENTSISELEQLSAMYEAIVRGMS